MWSLKSELLVLERLDELYTRLTYVLSPLFINVLSDTVPSETCSALLWLLEVEYWRVILAAFPLRMYRWVGEMLSLPCTWRNELSVEPLTTLVSSGSCDLWTLAVTVSWHLPLTSRVLSADSSLLVAGTCTGREASVTRDALWLSCFLTNV